MSKKMHQSKIRHSALSVIDAYDRLNESTFGIPQRYFLLTQIIQLMSLVDWSSP